MKPKEKKSPTGTAPTPPAPTPDPEKDENIVNKKLEREIAIMKLIQHPSIMALYDVYESPDELQVFTSDVFNYKSPNDE